MWFRAARDEEAKREVEVSSSLANDFDNIALNPVVRTLIQTVNGNEDWVRPDSRPFEETVEGRYTSDGFQDEFFHLYRKRAGEKVGVSTNSLPNVSFGLRD